MAATVRTVSVSASSRRSAARCSPRARNHAAPWRRITSRVAGESCSCIARSGLRAPGAGPGALVDRSGDAGAGRESAALRAIRAEVLYHADGPVGQRGAAVVAVEVAAVVILDGRVAARVGEPLGRASQ